MKKLALLSFLLCGCVIFAQDEFSINSDRPAVGYNANTVGKGVVLHQIGYQYARGLNQYITYYTYDQDITSNLRIGILDRLEVHWNFNYKISGLWEDNLSESDPRRGFYQSFKEKGVSLNSLGARYTIVKGEQWKPAFAVMAEINTPLISHPGTPQIITGNILAIANWNFKNGIFWGITAGTTNLGHIYEFPYAINFGGNIGQKTSLFIEYFGSFSSDPLNNDQVLINGIDGGVSFRPHKNIVLDLYGGWSLIDADTWSPDQSFFISTGITWAIQAWNKK